MKVFWLNLWRRLVARPTIILVFFLGLILVLGGWLWAILILGQIHQPLIVHFSSYTGITAIGGLSNFAYVAIFSLLVLVVNFCLALALEKRDQFWSKFMAITTLIYALLIFIGFAAIISVN